MKGVTNVNNQRSTSPTGNIIRSKLVLLLLIFGALLCLLFPSTLFSIVKLTLIIVFLLAVAYFVLRTTLQIGISVIFYISKALIVITSCLLLLSLLTIIANVL